VPESRYGTGGLVVMGAYIPGIEEDNREHVAIPGLAEIAKQGVAMDVNVSEYPTVAG
jgi:hypothetical protein